MLRSFGVDFVKVDRSVVVAAPEDAGARAVLSAVAAFARETGAFVIAEGIEDPELLAYVRGVGARSDSEGAIRGGQGYGMGRPQASLAEALEGHLLTSA